MILCLPNLLAFRLGLRRYMCKLCFFFVCVFMYKDADFIVNVCKLCVSMCEDVYFVVKMFTLW